MKFLQKSLNKLNGLHYRQEYLCLAKESFQNALHTYLIGDKLVIKDITDLHLFVGYSPLIFALPSTALRFPDMSTIQVALGGQSLQLNEPLKRKEAIAWLSLKKIHPISPEEKSVLFFEGIKGDHHFISGFHQLIIQLYNKLYNKKQGNVFLNSNLYKQVQIAYGTPRKICLVTVGENDLYNHFPTDLHGRVGDQYIISLRHGGKACQQVESAKKIVLCDIDAAAFDKVYALGKNHMQPLKERSSFDFSPASSRDFNLPLPKDLLSYKELELESSFTHGIHKLLQFKIVFEENLTSKPSTLSHIHNAYATWRYKQRISSNLLLR